MKMGNSLITSHTSATSQERGAITEVTTDATIEMGATTPTNRRITVRINAQDLRVRQCKRTDFS